MKLLQDRILKDGLALSDTVLKVDSFLNHQVDVELMREIGKDFAEHFKDFGITRIMTIESSGIAPAVFTALEMGVPMVILKKQTSKILTGQVFQTKVTSFTKGTSYELTLHADFVNKDDNVLIIDDFLANGEAATGACRLIQSAGAKVGGIGIMIEKSFQNGRDRLMDAGYHVYSQARIARLGEGIVEFVGGYNGED